LSIVLAAEGDRLTLALAIIGCITGVIGTLLSVLNYRRDRPRLTVSTVIDVDDEPTVHRITVVNRGRQPVAIVEVGFTWPSYHDYSSSIGRLRWHIAHARDRTLGWLIRPAVGPGDKFADSDYVTEKRLANEPLVLGPGEATVFRAPFDEVADQVEDEGRSGQPVWAYVEDAHGRRTRASYYSLSPSWGEELPPDPFPF
jgi:hypothetical protein